MPHAQPAIRADRPGTAVILMIAASALIAGTTLFAKALSTPEIGTPLHPLQITFGRFLFAFVGIATAAALLRPRLVRPHLGLHLMRTSAGMTGVTLMFAAVAYIPLADATAISFLNPVFAMMLAIPMLGERVGRWRWAAACIALAGALVLLRPTPSTFQPAALLALGAALIMGFEITVIKLLSGREPPFSILLVNNAIGVCIASAAVIWVWQTPSPTQWALMAGVGLLMASAQACFVNAMARAEASFVVPFSYITLVFAAAYDMAIFAVIPDAITGLGASIIIAGGALLAWREGRSRVRQP
ncbi:MAG: DMT family transporter [Pseudomonadota bacterium]